MDEFIERDFHSESASPCKYIQRISTFLKVATYCKFLTFYVKFMAFNGVFLKVSLELAQGTKGSTGRLIWDERVPHLSRNVKNVWPLAVYKSRVSVVTTP